MTPIQERPRGIFSSVRFLLTDMDETLTFNGRLAADTYCALEQLQQAGICVIPVTAAPAGWCDQMARMWPVNGVIGENGGFFFRRENHGHGLNRSFWHGEQSSDIMPRLLSTGRDIMRRIPQAKFAEDQAFRLTSLAFARTGDTALEHEISVALADEGLNTTINNLWILAWTGTYDKLAAARKVLEEEYETDDATAQQSLLYSGDSVNDAPMFMHYRHTVGVSTVPQYLAQLPKAPAWITDGPGGSGFVQAARAVLDDIDIHKLR